jgi:5-formyltetrahydrofolate cyclo-ligase
MPKRSLRQQILTRRRALSREEWRESSLMAQRQLMSLEAFRQAGCVALYAPAHNETDTSDILAAAFEAGKRVLYPAVCGDRMVLRQVLGVSCLSTGCFGILEPRPTGSDHLADEPDLIVVPGVVFDCAGHRIGYGKGYYDRFLQHPDRNAHLVGLCHDFQLIEGAIPAEQHDIRMEILVTDRRIVPCGSNRCL